MADLDPADRTRVRQFVERFHGDRSLLDLSEDELDSVLGLTTRGETGRHPTLIGLLLIRRESSWRSLVPTHEVAFQVLEEQEVRFNEFTRAPLLGTFEWLETSFGPLNAERGLQAGLFRVPIPLVDRRAFREAIANALTHRDYTRLGAVHVRLERDAHVVSNPRGFVEGVSLDNLLTTEPRPRNPSLADTFKRTGGVERTGRGVDLIYRGLLRFGRPRPDYSGLVQPHGRGRGRSYTLSAQVYASQGRQVAHSRQAGFDRVQQQQMVLGFAKQHGEIRRNEVMELCHLSGDESSRLLRKMANEGSLQAHGERRWRFYTLPERS